MKQLAVIAACLLAATGWAAEFDAKPSPFTAKLSVPFASINTNQPVVVGVLTAFRPSAAITWLSKEHVIGYGASMELPFAELTTWHLKSEIGVTYTTCQVLTPGKFYGKTYQLTGVGVAVELRSLVGGPPWLQNVSLFVALSARVDDPTDWAASVGTGVRF